VLSAKNLAFFLASSSLALFIGLKSTYWPPFPESLKLKLKLIFFEKQIWLPFLVSLLKLKLNLYFLKSRSGFGTKNLASFSSVALSAKNLAFFFWRFARLPFLPDSKAEIEKTVGICSSAQAYFF
jgi:hypothetical protein